jgi:hypothetical protein
MYQPSILLIGAIGIFTVKFWAVLWHITLWVDGTSFSPCTPTACRSCSPSAPNTA